MTTAVAVMAVAVAALGVLVVGLLRSHAEILRRLHELGAGVYEEEGGATTRLAAPEIRTRDGVPAPRAATGGAHDIAGTSPAGEAVVVGLVGAPHATLVAFLSTGCGTCAGFWEAFSTTAPAELGAVRLVVVTRGPAQESPAEVARLAPAAATTVLSDAAFDDYAVPVSPYFILVDGPTGRVAGEGAAATWPQVADLLRRATADGGRGAGRGPGSSAPRRSGGSQDRDARAEADLAAAGIGPGHPSLYPTAEGGEGRAAESGEVG